MTRRKIFHAYDAPHGAGAVGLWRYADTGEWVGLQPRLVFGALGGGLALLQSAEKWRERMRQHVARRLARAPDDPGDPDQLMAGELAVCSRGEECKFCRTPRCDRCDSKATGEEVCVSCDKSYRRCDQHGGEDGARRSLRSHNGLYHPRNPTRY